MEKVTPPATPSMYVLRVVAHATILSIHTPENVLIAL
jgi:hypothetical protein